jgi:5'-nucleotidase
MNQFTVKAMGGYIMLNRRKFLKRTVLAGAGLWALPSMAITGFEKLTILHTNDLHCHFEPFPPNDSRYPNRGGMNRISAYVKRLRERDPDILFFDSGDFSQGTPYYNFFKGELVFKLMSEMGYDASTIGNHEFDYGLKNFRNVMQYANFPLVSSNYDFSGTPLAGMIKEHLVFERKGIRIGVYGLGIELQGLVSRFLYGKTIYNDPLQTALNKEEYLRNNEKCDMIVCLSHLGFEYSSHKISDMLIAKNTRYTDLVLGGHTHTFLESPVEVINREKMPVVINQVGWASLMLGQLEFYIEKQNKPIIDMSENKRVG